MKLCFDEEAGGIATLEALHACMTGMRFLRDDVRRFE